VNYGGHSGGKKVQPKKPGPYGPATNNFKCEKSAETLYVTKSSFTADTKCFNVFKVECSQSYATGKDIGSTKECNEFTRTKCRTVFDTSSEERCNTIYKKQCEMVYETVTDWEYQQKCTTQYEKKCSGYGYHQECESVPKEICKQVPKKVEKQVPRTKCKDVPDKKCQDFPINIPRKECREFPKTVCTQDPIQITKKIPKKVCKAIPIEKCVKIPRQIISEVAQTVGKKLCTSKKPSYSAPSYHAPAPSYHAPAPSYQAPAPSYHAPAPSYSSPEPSYHAPAPSYHAPAPSYGYGKADADEAEEEDYISEDTGNIDLSYGAPKESAYSEMAFQYGATVATSEAPPSPPQYSPAPQYSTAAQYSGAPQYGAAATSDPYNPFQAPGSAGSAGIAPSDAVIADHWNLGT